MGAGTRNFSRKRGEGKRKGEVEIGLGSIYISWDKEYRGVESQEDLVGERERQK